MITNILEYLESSADRSGSKLALSDGRHNVTFAEWLDFAKRIGSELSRFCNGAMRRPVIVFVDRRIETLVAFMGVVMSGNFYVPIDCKMPAERVRKIAATLNPLAAVTLTDVDDATLDAAGYSGVRFRYDQIVVAEAEADLLGRIRSQIIDLDPVYSIFTSGSTGDPKGVLIPHRAMIDFAEWMVGRFGLNENDVIGNQAPFYFDCSVKDICICLKTSATLHIIPRKCFSFPKLLGKFLNEKRVTSLWWATSAVILTANSGILDEDPPRYVRIVTFGGESISPKQLNAWRRNLPNATYVNVYGPTEVTVDCTYYVIDREFDDDEVIPIGRSIENKQVLVFNEEDKLVGINEPGELCMRGTGRALGYYNNPEKTAAAFVQNPLHNLYEDKIYRTGDIVKYNERGELVFVSRKDFQIKHMGNRIELGEIEAAVNSIPDILESACVYDKGKEQIVLYYTTGTGVEVDIVNLVKDKIPKYMYPNVSVCLKKMPHNANGKIDRVELLALTNPSKK